MPLVQARGGRTAESPTTSPYPAHFSANCRQGIAFMWLSNTRQSPQIRPAATTSKEGNADVACLSQFEDRE
jgi:hypothetical protein